MEAIPELRMETEDRQSTEYEVHHQKLVNIHHLPSHASWCSDLIFPRGCVSNLSSLVKIPRLSPWRWVSVETTSIMCHAVLCTSQRNICALCIWGKKKTVCVYVFTHTDFCSDPVLHSVINLVQDCHATSTNATIQPCSSPNPKSFHLILT